ncbi:MAG: hypothetical protein J6J65_08655 [Opitutales bacterium]|nr:hypothetical protein [Opitutales bacterium]
MSFNGGIAVPDSPRAEYFSISPHPPERDHRQADSQRSRFSFARKEPFFPQTFDFLADYRPQRHFFPQTNPNTTNRSQLPIFKGF